MSKKLYTFLPLVKLFVIFSFSLTLISSCAKEEQITINIFNWYSPDEEVFLDALKHKVEKELPNVTIEFEQVVWDKMHPFLASKIAAGTVPDILDLKGQDINKYGGEGVLLDLSGQTFLDNIPSSAREYMKVDGKEYGVPYTALYQGVFYNRDIFKKYNLDIPETTAELEKIVKTLESNGVIPFATHYKDNWNIGNITMQFAMSEVFNKNPRWGYELYDGRQTFEESEGYTRVFQHAKYLYDHSWKDTYSVDLAECDKRFADGEAAMNVSGTWSIMYFERLNPDLNYGIFPFPGKDAGAKLIFEPDHTWAVSANTKHKDIVLKILEIIASDKELATIEIDASKTNSLLIGVNPSKEYSFTKDIEKYKNNNKIIDVSIGNVQIKWPYQEEYSRYITEWILGEKTLQNALKEATIYKEKITLK